MQGVVAGISQNNFVVLGRAGMDFFPDPPGTKTEESETFRAGLGGSSANIAAGVVKLGGKAALVTSVSDDSVGIQFATWLGGDAGQVRGESSSIGNSRHGAPHPGPS